MLVDIIAGARPNFVKIAPLIKEFRARAQRRFGLKYRLIHTGQHYDQRMSADFFDQLGIPEPDINFGVGSGTHAAQTAAIMIAYERVIQDKRPSLTMVFGDVNSTFACAVVAKKFEVPVAHVEAGIRSGDLSMPEEINRILTDSITDYFFTTSESAGANLLRLGVSAKNIFFVGNTMIDCLKQNQSRFTPPDFFEMLALKPRQYFVITLHRPANVDDANRLTELLNLISTLVKDDPVVFPIHPRTRQMLGSEVEFRKNICIVQPQPYLQFNFLVQNARAVLTDSGGITEETTLMNVPCLSLRLNTERPETIEQGTTELVGVSPDAISTAINRVFKGQWKKGSLPKYWDGKTSARIMDHLESLFC